MFTSPFQPAGEKLRILLDPSTFKIAACPRQLLYVNLLGYRTRKPSPATEFGQAVHQAAAALRRGATKIDAFGVGLDYYLASPADFTGDYRTSDLLYSVLNEYLDFRERDAFQVTTPPGVELSYEVPFMAYEHCDISIAGVIDEVGILNGSLRFLDIKTTGLYPGKFTSKWRTSQQMLIYSWILKHTGVTKHYASPIIDAIFLRGKASERIVRMDDNAIQPSHVEECMDHVRTVCDNVAEWVKHERFQLNRSCCETVFGDCQFRGICDALPSMRDSMLRTLYKQTEYDPSKFGINHE